MMTDNRNMILAVILSGVVLLAWQYFYNVPQMERQRAQQAQQTELQKSATKPADTTSPSSAPLQPGSTTPSPATPAASAAPVVSRDQALADSQRVKI
jgi:YidC/Oxa1 family membrane protein insertase